MAASFVLRPFAGMFHQHRLRGFFDERFTDSSRRLALWFHIRSALGACGRLAGKRRLQPSTRPAPQLARARARNRKILRPVRIPARNRALTSVASELQAIGARLNERNRTRDGDAGDASGDSQLLRKPDRHLYRQHQKRRYKVEYHNNSNLVFHLHGRGFPRPVPALCADISAAALPLCAHHRIVTRDISSLRRNTWLPVMSVTSMRHDDFVMPPRPKTELMVLFRHRCAALANILYWKIFLFRIDRHGAMVYLSRHPRVSRALRFSSLGVAHPAPVRPRPAGPEMREIGGGGAGRPDIGCGPRYPPG